MTDKTCCGACGYPVHATKEMACDWCRQSADRIEELSKERDQHWDSFVHWRKEADDRSEQLAAARQDAKAAEDELELQEQEACMMENNYIKLEKDRDALEAKLAKAVGALEIIRDRQYYHMGPGITAQVIALATLAEIKGT